MASQCIIGKNIQIRGKLAGSEDLVVEGRIEGTVALKNHLTIEQTRHLLALPDRLSVPGAVLIGLGIMMGVRSAGLARAAKKYKSLADSQTEGQAK